MAIKTDIFIRLVDNIIYDININDFELNFSLSDIQNLNAAKTAFSIPIKIPYTPRNTQIFGTLFNINNSSDITKEKIECKLIWNGCVLIDGYCYIDNFDLDDIRIIISRADLTIFQEIGEKTLFDLLLTGASYTYNNKTYEQYWDDMNSYAYTDDDVSGTTHRFIISDWYGKAKTKVYNRNQNMNVLFSPLYRFSPVVRVKHIFDEIMSQNSYTYTMSSDFEDKLEKMYMSVNTPIENYTTNAYSYIFFALTYVTDARNGNVYLAPYEYASASRSFNTISTENNYSSATNSNLRAIYPFMNGSTEYQFNYQVQAYNSSAGLENSLKIYLHKANRLSNADLDPNNSYEILIGEMTITGTSIYDVYTSEKKFVPTDLEILNVGNNTYDSNNYDSYYIRIEKDAATTALGHFVNIKCPGFMYDTTNTYTLNDLLPVSYKQKDFLNDILSMFNIYIYVDDNKKHLNFLTYDDFYNDDVLDWSDKIDFDKIEISDLTKEMNENYILSFKNGDDLISKSHNEKYNNILNQQNIENNSEICKKDTENITLSIAQNIFTTEIVSSLYGYQQLGISSNYTNESAKNSFGFINKLYFYDYFINMEYLKQQFGHIESWDYNQWQFKLKWSDYYLTLSPFLIDTTFLSDIADADTFALQFNTEEQYLINYTLSSDITNNNLYNRYWLNEMDSKINGKQKFLKINIKLNTKDLDILNFRKKIWIANEKLGQSYYRLNKIVFPSDENKLSKVELIKLTNYSSSYDDTIFLHKLYYNPLTDSNSVYGGSTGSISGGGGGAIPYDDSGLQTQLSTEISDRTAADGSLSTGVSTFVSALINYDGLLSTSIAGEISDRISADISIVAQIGSGVYSTGVTATDGVAIFDGVNVLKSYSGLTFDGKTLGLISGTGNLFIGEDAGSTNSTGIGNTFIGKAAGEDNTTADDNTFIGNAAGANNITGTTNTFLGSGAGVNNTYGQANTFLGYNAGTLNEIGNNNTYIGKTAGQQITEGSDNVIIGWQSGYAGAGINRSVFIGSKAGMSAVIGSNVFIGYEAGKVFNHTSNQFNIFIGYGTCYDKRAGSNNIIMGTLTSYENDGSDNIVIGNGSNQGQNSYQNIVIGNAAGGANNGAYNINIGQFAGNWNIDGSGNTCIGIMAGLHNTGSNQLHIGGNGMAYPAIVDVDYPLIYGEFDNQRLLINGTLEVVNGSDNYIYMGEKDTDNSWRFAVSGSDLIIQRRISGTWTTKSTITG